MALAQIAVLLALAGNAVAVNNGLARTPQMGWVSQARPICPKSYSLLTAEQLELPGLRCFRISTSRYLEKAS
jgi:hypothetical protein